MLLTMLIFKISKTSNSQRILLAIKKINAMCRKVMNAFTEISMSSFLEIYRSQASKWTFSSLCIKRNQIMIIISWLCLILIILCSLSTTQSTLHQLLVTSYLRMKKDLIRLLLCDRLKLKTLSQTVTNQCSKQDTRHLPYTLRRWVEFKERSSSFKRTIQEHVHILLVKNRYYYPTR